MKTVMNRNTELSLNAPTVVRFFHDLVKFYANSTWLISAVVVVVFRLTI